jgi:hypothetical protein
MQTQAHNMGPEERALIEQRRSAVAHQLRCLATELTDLDRQLDEIEQSEDGGTPSALRGHIADQ